MYDFNFLSIIVPPKNKKQNVYVSAYTFRYGRYKHGTLKCSKHNFLMQLFNQQFFARVLLACFIGLPVAYYASKEWLKGFAYKVEIHAGLFIFVFLTSVFVVLAITTWQTRKAARQNPIDTLKTE